MVLQAVLLILLAKITPWTWDEPNYLSAGIALRDSFDFSKFPTILHGPLPFYANQLLAEWAVPLEPLVDYKLAGRLGMLPFSLLATLILGLWTRATMGAGVGLLAALLWCLNPLTLAHGCLMTADMALTATWLLTSWLAWRWFQGPSLRRLVLAGLALGMSLATKYLALLLIPILAIAFVWSCAQGFRPRLLWSKKEGAGVTARMADLIPTLAIVGLASWFSLNSCYLWQTHGYRLLPHKENASPQDPNAGALSGTFRSLEQTPVVPGLLRLLPEPFVRGIDYQKFYSDSQNRTIFNGQVGPGFATFYVTALGLRVPVTILLLLLLGSIVRAPPWPRWQRPLVLLSVLIPLAYLSFGSSLQMGARYLLMIVPFLSMVAARGALALLAQRHRWSVWLGRSAACGLLLWLIIPLATAWPRYLEHWNCLVTRPYLIFHSALDWTHSSFGQGYGEEFARRHPNNQIVYEQSGPRFGKLSAHARQLSPADPRDPNKVHHWLRAFSPTDRLGIWYAFDVTEAGFRSLAAGDHRLTTELAKALIGAGKPKEALSALQGNTDPEAGKVRALAEHAIAGPEGTDRAHLLQVIGRWDLIAEATEQIPDLLRATALHYRDRHDQAATLLQELESRRPLSLLESLALANLLWNRLGRPEDAIELLRRHEPGQRTPGHKKWEELMRRARQATQAQKAADPGLRWRR